MHYIKVHKIGQMFGYPADIGLMIGRKQTSTSTFLKDFREFVKKRPNYFNPHVPVRKCAGEMTQYNILCVLHYWLRKDLLDAGTRLLNFADDVENCQAMLRNYAIGEEVV